MFLHVYKLGPRTTNMEIPSQGDCPPIIVPLIIN